jgi:aminopeptidase N
LKVPLDRDFLLETTTQLGENKDLFGLYETEGTVLVKAETEGLRRVFYCLDRPDVLAVYTTTIYANKAQYPVLLSNGVQTQAKDVDEHVHCATWYDELQKPTYLFAMVAGRLERSVSNHKTLSGRLMPLIFYVPVGAKKRCDFAKAVLHEAISWDEEANQLPCLLPQHMVAGVDRYASGASETTGLNLFNTENLYATLQTKTDLGFLRVLEVLAHEWFHTKSGNETTIRDWCNLTFKEGLTTYRAARFCDFLFGADLMRLLEGKNLDERAPRPNGYTAVRSLYTAAAYDKSAHIFRMMELVVGQPLFNQGITHFLTTNKGKAVTVEDLLDELSHFTAVDLNVFLPWFTQTGIPKVQVKACYELETQKYFLTFEVLGGKDRPIPVALGLLDAQGKEIQPDTLLVLKEGVTHCFEQIPSQPIPSLLRSFSAPVVLEYDYSLQELNTLLRYDTNTYNRVDAAKKIACLLIKNCCEGKPMHLEPFLLDTYKSMLTDSSKDFWILAELLSIPSEEELLHEFSPPPIEKIAHARALLVQSLAKALEPQWEALHTQLAQCPDTTTPRFAEFDIQDAGKRRLMAVCSSYRLTTQPERVSLELMGLFNATLKTNMTQCTNALILLCESNAPFADEALHRFYEVWRDDSNAINYWFKIQSAMHHPSVVQRVEALLKHPAFDLTSPNKVYALLNPFIKNPYGFHAPCGGGYQLVAKVVLQIDQINPTLSAKMTEPYLSCARLDLGRQNLAQNALKGLSEQACSLDLKAVVSRAEQILSFT